MITLGTLLQNRYRVVRKIGAGGFAKIFEVDDSGTPKILKVLNLERFQSEEIKQKALFLFQQEAVVLKKLSSRKVNGIPKIDGYFTHKDGINIAHCIVMEKIPGENLKEWMKKRNHQPITRQLAIDWLKQLAIILKKIHEMHYFHRDIKPENIMLKPDGRLVLIDFGTARKITNTYIINLEDCKITLLGSAGYLPVEQANGKAVPVSDFYAAGRTFVYLLTGIEPSSLSQDDLTQELIWRHEAVGKPLGDLIDRMMAFFPKARPTNAQAILQRLAEIELAGETEVPETPKTVAATAAVTGSVQKIPIIKGSGFFRLLLTSTVVTSLVMGVRQLGILQGWEFLAFDSMLRLRGTVSPSLQKSGRLLVVEATEADIKKYGYPIADAVLAQLFDKLEKDKPRAIALNIARDIPTGNNQEQIKRHWQHNNRLIVNCAFRDASKPNSAITPPSGIPENRIGFTNLVKDSDDIIRRQLLFLSPIEKSACSTEYSFSFRLAQRYLEAVGIQPQNTPQGYIQLGKAIFKPLHLLPGVYRNEELGGVQVLLNYHSGDKFVQTVSLRQVLENQVNPNLIKNRIVLIGMNLQTDRKYSTPYSREVPAVMIQAQMVSQILNAAIDDRALLEMLPQRGEILWVWGWAMVGGILAMRSRRLIYLELAVGVTAIALSGCCFILLIRGSWVPLVPSALALITTSSILVAFQESKTPSTASSSQQQQTTML